MFTVLAPSPALAGLVHAYWFVEDLPGKYAGHPVQTSPVPYVVLSVNIGHPNAADNGELVPATSLLGLQSRVRSWRSRPGTYFVMALLTIPGVLKLFPYVGSEAVNTLLDLGSVIGDASAYSLSACVGADLAREEIAVSLDRWLVRRLMHASQVPEIGQIVTTLNMLRGGGTVNAAAAQTQVQRRQIHRLFRRHLGIGPKDVADLERLHASLKGVQSGCGDPMHGFSDQPHQIRNWRKRLGRTPGAYVRQGRTEMAAYFGSDREMSGVAYYL